jgi:hypothetical protein
MIVLVSMHLMRMRGQALCSLLEPISRAKYPDLSEEEERISLPLQVRERGWEGGE